jgi:HSP20 family protein
VSRAFSLGSEIDQGKVEANYKDGVLQLTLPKKASSDVPRITVK